MMEHRKNVLLLFSKLPEPGLVKTRLTTLKDGIFDPETASALYHRMLFDVVEIIMAAFDRLDRGSDDAAMAGVSPCDEYRLVISTTPVSNVAAMEKLFADAGKWPRPIEFIGDEGASFDEHYNDAFAKAWELGADYILSMGADMPALTVDDVAEGFRALHRLDAEGALGGGIVLAPDQEMGVSVIGWTRATRFDHSGVFYNQEGLTVLPAYVRKAAEAGLPAIYLRPVPDVDTMQDLVHTATLLEATNYCAPFDGNCPGWRTWEMLCDLGLNDVRVPPNALRDPRGHIDGDLRCKQR